MFYPSSHGPPRDRGWWPSIAALVLFDSPAAAQGDGRREEGRCPVLYREVASPKEDGIGENRAELAEVVAVDPQMSAMAGRR
jgi:hypothetical protein